jgi:hypothetical protein
MSPLGQAQSLVQIVALKGHRRELDEDRGEGRIWKGWCRTGDSARLRCFSGALGCAFLKDLPPTHLKESFEVRAPQGRARAGQ